MENTSMEHKIENGNKKKQNLLNSETENHCLLICSVKIAMCITHVVEIWTDFNKHLVEYHIIYYSNGAYRIQKLSTCLIKIIMLVRFLYYSDFYDVFMLGEVFQLSEEYMIRFNNKSW